jgi:hypothetical protein
MVCPMSTSNPPLPFLVFCLGLVCLIVVAIPVGLLLPHWGVVIIQGGTLLWVLGFLGYIVAVDSRRRWPHLSAVQRYIKVVTFQR